MDLYLERVFYVELNLIITKGTLNPLILEHPEVSVCTIQFHFHPRFNMETSMLLFIGLFSIFSIIIPSDFPEDVPQHTSATFQTLTPDIISRLLI